MQVLWQKLPASSKIELSKNGNLKKKKKKNLSTS